MCLIVFAYECHSTYRLILAANRDEYFARPTRPAEYWPEHPSILAGRDLRSGGTWLGLTRRGRLAAVTNYRDPRWIVPDPPSRGLLVADYLSGDLSPERFLAEVKSRGHLYQGFNLLLGDLSKLFYYSNRGDAIRIVGPGVHGLSNHLMDTSWPKVTVAKSMLENLLGKGSEDPEDYYSILTDRKAFPDHELPETGVGIELERHLSPIFVSGRSYGTRFSTLIFIDRKNRAKFIERSYGPQDTIKETTEFSLTLKF